MVPTFSTVPIFLQHRDLVFSWGIKRSELARGFSYLPMRTWRRILACKTFSSHLLTVIIFFRTNTQEIFFLSTPITSASVLLIPEFLRMLHCKSMLSRCPCWNVGKQLAGVYVASQTFWKTAHNKTRHHIQTDKFQESLIKELKSFAKNRETREIMQYARVDKKGHTM